MRRRLKETCQILVEGESEAIYFSALAQLPEFRTKYAIHIHCCNGNNKIIDIALGRKKKLLRKYSRNIFILDKDNINKNDLLTIQRNHPNNIGFTNPKFELWLLASEQQIFSTYNGDPASDLKSLFPWYNKTHHKIADFAPKWRTSHTNTRQISMPNYYEASTNLGAIIESLL